MINGSADSAALTPGGNLIHMCMSNFPSQPVK